MKARALQGDGDFRILGEGLPHEARAEVFGHEDSDAEIDAEDVGIVPLGVRVEGVAEAVSSPRVLGVAIPERVENLQAWAGEKWERAGGGVGNDGAVDATETLFVVAATAWASPCGVSVL